MIEKGDRLVMESVSSPPIYFIVQKVNPINVKLMRESDSVELQATKNWANSNLRCTGCYNWAGGCKCLPNDTD